MSSKGWQITNLENICQIICGATPSTIVPEYWSDEIKWATAKDVSESLGYKIYDTERKISKLGFKNCSTKMIPKESTILIARGATMGRSCILGEDMAINQTCYALLADNDKINPYFLFYSIKNLDSFFQQIAHGAIFNTVIGSNLRETRIDLPPLSVQHRIANILSTLDDKIELNRQTNATLESIAQAIFKEWFVDFLFPGATGEMQESELGRIPRRWKVDTFENEFEAERGLSYKGDGLTIDNLAMPMHNLNSVHEGGSYKFEGIKYYSGQYKEKHIIYPGDLIVANTEQGHKYLLIGYPAIVPTIFGNCGIYSHHLYRVKPKPHSYITSEFLYHLFLQPEIREQVVGFANGTTVNMLKIEGLQKPKFILPPRELVSKFTELASNIRLWQEEAVKECDCLAQIRDNLLPKLMNGELEL
jgi:type I restriction enzyme, S subunit